MRDANVHVCLHACWGEYCELKSIQYFLYSTDERGKYTCSLACPIPTAEGESLETTDVFHSME